MPAEFTQHITFLSVRSLEASEAFYSGLLRLPLARDQGSCRIYRVAPNAYLGLCQQEDAPPPAGNLIVTLVTDDVEGWYALALAHGANIEGPPRHNDHYLITHWYLRDPDGYRVEIQRFDDPLNGLET